MSVNYDLVYIAAITAVPATIAAAAALSGARNAKRGRKEAAESLDTGNAKKLGHTVHDIAQTTEAIAAQVHTNAAEILDINRKMDDHLKEVVPLIARYKGECATKKGARKRAAG